MQRGEPDFYSPAISGIFLHDPQLAFPPVAAPTASLLRPHARVEKGHPLRAQRELRPHGPPRPTLPPIDSPPIAQKRKPTTQPRKAPARKHSPALENELRGYQAQSCSTGLGQYNRRPASRIRRDLPPFGTPQQERWRGERWVERPPKNKDPTPGTRPQSPRTRAGTCKDLSLPSCFWQISGDGGGLRERPPPQTGKYPSNRTGRYGDFILFRHQ